MSLLVPDFTMSPYGSSCKYVFFSLILATLLSSDIYWPPPPQSRMVSQNKDGDRKKRENQTQKEKMNCCTQKL